MMENDTRQGSPVSRTSSFTFMFDPPPVWLFCALPASGLRSTLPQAEVLATPEHLWGREWMVPEPSGGGVAGSGVGAVDNPNWNARNH